MAEGYQNVDHPLFIFYDQQISGNNFDDSNIPNGRGYFVICNNGYFIIGYRGSNKYSAQLRFGYWENSLWFRMKNNSETWSDWKRANFS